MVNDYITAEVGIKEAFEFLNNIAIEPDSDDVEIYTEQMTRNHFRHGSVWIRTDGKIVSGGEILRAITIVGKRYKLEFALVKLDKSEWQQYTGCSWNGRDPFQIIRRKTLDLTLAEKIELRKLYYTT